MTSRRPRRAVSGMPDRDYYTKTDDASKKLRDQYVAHVTKMLTLLGDHRDKAAAGCQEDPALETSWRKRRARAWSCAIRRRTTTR